MPSNRPVVPRIAIIGAGISGLSAALRLRERLPDAELAIFDASLQPGGVVRTIHQDGFLVESSADSFITSMPWALQLCQRLGLDDQIIETDATYRRAFVVRRGKLLPIPDGLMIMAPSRIGPLITTPILSPWGKLRMVAEAFVPRGTGQDESLASFVRRRFGREAFDRLIQPLVGGMYTGDPERLSVQATMPRFLDMERKHGSLIRAMRHKPTTGSNAGTSSGARYSLFVGLAGGMSVLVDALVRALPPEAIQLGTHVERLTRNAEGRWELGFRGDRAPASFDRVVIAASIRQTQSLLKSVDPELSASFENVASASSAIVSLGYLREQIQHPLDGFGFVVPQVERLPILSGSFSSVKFPGRAPSGQVLIRVFLGGTARPDLLQRDDAALVQTAHDELSRLLGIHGKPVMNRVSRWNEAMPQYQVGHLDWIASVRSRLAQWPGLELAGNGYEGVGVPQCIHSGEQAAERMIAAIEMRASSPTVPA